MKFFLNWTFILILTGMVGTGIVYPQIEREKQDAALKKICLEMNGQIAYTGPQLDKLTCNYTIPQLPLK
jgi:hypothetical protein